MLLCYAVSRHFCAADMHPALLELRDIVHLHRLLKLLYFIKYTIVNYTNQSVVIQKILWRSTILNC
jgi:FMN phosphatase YigB (HAD superfamily)